MNKVILIGNLARDPELRTTQSGVTMCRFTLAVNRRVPNAQGVREADFINCVAWRQTAEFVSRYFTKGKRCAVVGSLQVRSYEAQDGSKRTAAEVVVDDVEFVERASQGGGHSDEEGSAPPRSASPARNTAPQDDFIAVDDDELPF